MAEYWYGTVLGLSFTSDIIYFLPALQLSFIMESRITVESYEAHYYRLWRLLAPNHKNYTIHKLQTWILHYRLVECILCMHNPSLSDYVWEAWPISSTRAELTRRSYCRQLKISCNAESWFLQLSNDTFIDRSNFTWRHSLKLGSTRPRNTTLVQRIAYEWHWGLQEFDAAARILVSWIIHHLTRQK